MSSAAERDHSYHKLRTHYRSTDLPEEATPYRLTLRELGARDQRTT